MNWSLTHIIPAETIQVMESRWASLKLPAGLVARIAAYNVRSAIPLQRRWFRAEPLVELPDKSIKLVFRFGLEAERTIAEEAIQQVTSNR